MRRRIGFTLSLLLVALAAQASKTRLKMERIDASEVSDGVVRIYASVVELEGEVDDGRPASAFNLKVNGKSVGKPESVKRFQLSGDPLDLVLVVESSQLYGQVTKAAPPAGAPPPPPPPVAKKGKSAKKGKEAKKTGTKFWAPPVTGEEPLERVKEAVTELLEKLSPKWRVFVIDYGGEVTAHPPFRPAQAMVNEIESLSPDGDASDLKLVSAIDAALLELSRARIKANEKEEKPPRRLIAVISDGLNFNMDRKIFRTLGNKAATEMVPIHAIAFSPTDDRGPLINLGEISKRSNGTFRWARTADDLKSQLETLADELNKQYVLTYKLDDIENKTLQLYCGDLVSTPVKFTKERLEKTGARGGLAWYWWTAIILGIVLVGGFIVILVLANRTETVALGARPGQQQQQAPPPQQQAPRGGGALIQDSSAQQRAAAGGVHVVGGGARAAARSGVLVVLGGQLGGTKVAVQMGSAPVLIGKGPATLQILDDPTVSTRHAQLHADQNGFVLTDLGSTNGTFVNNHKIQGAVLLGDGDLIRFGNTQMKFRTE